MPYAVVLAKPDAHDRDYDLVAMLKARFTSAVGAPPIAERTVTAGTEGFEALLREHYAEHAHRPFFEGLVAEMARGPITAWLFEAADAAAKGRAALPSIRDKYARDVTNNTAHCSDSDGAGRREAALWFDV